MKIGNIAWLAFDLVSLPAATAIAVATNDTKITNVLTKDIDDRLSELRKDEASDKRSKAADQ